MNVTLAPRHAAEDVTRLKPACLLPAPRVGHVRLRCGSQLSFDSCLTPASPSPHHVTAGRRPEITPGFSMSPACSSWRQLTVIRSSRLVSPRGCGCRHDMERKRKEAVGQGWRRSCRGDVWGGQPSLWCLCRPSLCRGHPAEMSQPVPSPGSAAACVILLLSCACLGSAVQVSPSKCLGGSRG